MAAYEKLLQRVRQNLDGVKKLKEKKMFSGITFIIQDKMCISVGPDRLMLRVDPVMHEELVDIPGCRAVIMKEREMKGFIYVFEDILQTEKQLNHWISLALAFNPNAKSSKKKQ